VLVVVLLRLRSCALIHLAAVVLLVMMVRLVRLVLMVLMVMMVLMLVLASRPIRRGES
jgi:hypothetical protein